MRDSSGKQWASLDTQPGYGFQPTSAWQPGVLNDAYTLSLPGDLLRDEPYSLDVIVYQVASLREVGRTSIDGLRLDDLYAWKNIEPPVRSFAEPTISQRVDASFGDQIRLLGYDVSHEGNVLTLKPAWRALSNIAANYKVFVHVFDPATEKIVAQSDSMPRNNAYPTSRWLNGEVVTDTLVISLADVPAGSYRIALGVYLPPSDRLPINGEHGIDAVNRRVIIDETVDVP